MKDISITKDNPASLLVVDDEPLIRKMLTKYLSHKNYNIDTAEDGSDALEKLEKNSYDLVLTDLRMPKIGGGELLQIMSKQFPDIPKIVLTAYGTNEDIILALKTGAYDFLNKPIVDFNILEYSIHRAIERKRLNDDRNRYFDQLKQINQIISMLNSGKNTEDIFNTLNITLKRFLPFNRLALVTIQKDKNLIITKLVSSDREVLLEAGVTVPLTESSLYDASEKKNVLNIEDLNDYLKLHPDSVSTKMLIQEGMFSSLVLPLIVNNVTRGFLIFASEMKGAFMKEHVSFLESIVGQISLSIQRGELLYEIELHTKNLEHLVDLRSSQILKTQRTTIFALSRLAETRDPETGEHLERIRNYSALLAQILKYIGNHKEITNQYLKDLYDSSILHDIGKVGIPDGILRKEGFLSDKEFEIMKTHTTIGYEALKHSSKDLGESSFLDMAMDIILFHHERWDQKGYPMGLNGMNIPLSARIVALADVYDALISKRPYKEAYSHEKSIKIMQEESNRFDPEIFKIFIDNQDEFDRISKEFK